MQKSFLRLYFYGLKRLWLYQISRFIVNRDKYQAEQDVKFIKAAKFLTGFWKEVKLCRWWVARFCMCCSWEKGVLYARWSCKVDEDFIQGKCRVWTWRYRCADRQANLWAKINKGSGTELLKCESHDGNKSILQGAAFLYGRLVPPYTQVTCSSHVLIGFYISMTLVVVLSQIGVGGEFFKDIFDCEMADLGIQQKKPHWNVVICLRNLLWFPYLCSKPLFLLSSACLSCHAAINYLQQQPG